MEYIVVYPCQRFYFITSFAPLTKLPQFQQYADRHGTTILRYFTTQLFSHYFFITVFTRSTSSLRRILEHKQSGKSFRLR